MDEDKEVEAPRVSIPLNDVYRVLTRDRRIRFLEDLVSKDDEESQKQLSYLMTQMRSTVVQDLFRPDDCIHVIERAVGEKETRLIGQLVTKFPELRYKGGLMKLALDTLNPYLVLMLHESGTDDIFKVEGALEQIFPGLGTGTPKWFTKKRGGFDWRVTGRSLDPIGVIIDDLYIHNKLPDSMRVWYYRRVLLYAHDELHASYIWHQRQTNARHEVWGSAPLLQLILHYLTPAYRLQALCLCPSLPTHK